MSATRLLIGETLKGLKYDQFKRFWEFNAKRENTFIAENGVESLALEKVWQRTLENAKLFVRDLK